MIDRSKARPVMPGGPDGPLGSYAAQKAPEWAAQPVTSGTLPESFKSGLRDGQEVAQLLPAGVSELEARDRLMDQLNQAERDAAYARGRVVGFRYERDRMRGDTPSDLQGKD